jgi:FkbM family methyltransferase
MIKQLADAILRVDPSLKFTMLEIGARGVHDKPEPFYSVFDLFPQSSIIGFEVEKDLCDRMNAEAKEGLKYFPVALSDTEGEKQFFVTSHPMCCSLYEPNPIYIDLYNNLQYQELVKKTFITTTTLDEFAERNSIEKIDFIKVDVQGAELDIFKGGLKTLSDCLYIISEVEFVELYKAQPLFGDVSHYLGLQGFMFHKFNNFGGRSLKPIIVKKDLNTPIQWLWADAIFTRKIDGVKELMPDQLLKLAVLAFVYESVDLTYFCLQLFDRNSDTQLAPEFLSWFG